MPRKKKDQGGGQRGPRPFWSGAITFGLVSLSVGLFPANRGKAVSLHMVDQDGTRLRRRYFCSKEETLLDGDDLVRGYPLGKDEYVVIEDQELASLAPEKSQEIDLKRFVPVSELDPIRFERAYFLTPDQGAIKAYRLLAKSMEESGRAGIATFVMRGKERLVAILARDGILRAETLRFFDELRSPDDVGLPAKQKAKAKDVQRFQTGIKHLMKDDFEEQDLQDRGSQAIVEQAKRKLKSGKDVAQKAPARRRKSRHGPADDLMATIKKSLREGRTPPDAPPEKKSTGRDLATLSKQELYEEAKRLGVEGRSQMNKSELQKAIRASG
jgi:DNA end-binding protein Ku